MSESQQWKRRLKPGNHGIKRRLANKVKHKSLECVASAVNGVGQRDRTVANI